VLAGLDDAIAAGQTAQHDRATGQTSLFELAAADGAALERPLPSVPEAPLRERLRWEKELLGLYLSEHPMGEVAALVGEYVTAYSGDLKDESLDGQRIVVGGIVVGSRTVVTRTRSTMAVVTLEDLQGSLEVVVFPRLYEQTAATWQEGAILLVAGRVDHRGEDVSLLADVVLTWEDAVGRGPEGFAREVAAGERSGLRRRVPAPANSGPWTNGNGSGAPPEAVAVGPGRVAAAVGSATVGSAPAMRAGVPYVSPLRDGVDPRPIAEASLPPIAPAEPVPTHLEPEDPSHVADHDEPALPDEARARVAAEATAPTTALATTGAAQVLHVRFGGAPAERLVRAMETFRALVRERPGETRVVVHVPAPGGAALPMELKQPVAYDAELLAEVRRRLGDGVVDLSLA
jgi:hypothetical protein